jgi:hypothetical protein
MKRLLTLTFIVILLSGCTSSRELFTSIKQSDQDNYGLSIENPILIGYFNNWQKNTDLAYDYLSKLKYKNKSLHFVFHATLEKPLNQPRKSKPDVTLQSIYGIPKNLGGNTLDLFVMVPRGTNDTLKLYFDVEIKGEIMIPMGFDFDPGQINNVYK